MNSSAVFVNWLERYADAAGVDRATLLREQTMLINRVVCTFLYPAMGRDDVVAVLIDAGEIECPSDDSFLREAISRNLENFLLGAPLFLYNPESRRLVIGKEFEFKNIEPTAFKATLDALAMQALTWQQRKG